MSTKTKKSTRRRNTTGESKGDATTVIIDESATIKPYAPAHVVLARNTRHAQAIARDNNLPTAIGGYDLGDGSKLTFVYRRFMLREALKVGPTVIIYDVGGQLPELRKAAEDAVEAGTARWAEVADWKKLRGEG